MTNAVGESIYSVIMWNIYCESVDKHDFSRDLFNYRVNYNLKDRKLSSDQMNSNRFDPILNRRDWSCSSMENLRCLNCAVNEMIL